MGWRLEAGGWRLEAGGWRLETGGVQSQVSDFVGRNVEGGSAARYAMRRIALTGIRPTREAGGVQSQVSGLKSQVSSPMQQHQPGGEVGGSEA